MPTFATNDIRLAYEVAGDGPPIILLHGFASSAKRNWKEPSWFDTLIGAGRQIIAPDFRGHGGSDKPHDSAHYSADAMTSDIVRLLDHLGHARVDLMGYSMGGRIAAALVVGHPERFNCAVLAGVGAGLIGERLESETIAKALEMEDRRQIVGLTERAFRSFAEAGGNDLAALAACMRGLRRVVGGEQLRTIRIPVLIVVGERDELVGDPRPLADRIDGATLVRIPGKDHLTTVGSRLYKDAVLRFLEEHRTSPTR